MTPNLIVAISGNPKTGKTHWALTFPDPTVIYSLDIGLDRVLPHFPDIKLEIRTYPIPLLDTVHPKPYAQKIWQDIKTDYQADLESGDFKTVIFDPATSLYELCRHAYTEELGQKQLLPVQYGEVFARMSSTIMAPRFHNVNLVLTHYLRPRYVNDKETGELELDGYKRTEGLVDVVLTTERRRKTGKQGNEILTTVQDCGFDLDVSGYSAVDMNYTALMEILGLEVE